MHGQSQLRFVWVLAHEGGPRLRPRVARSRGTCPGAICEKACQRSLLIEWLRSCQSHVMGIAPLMKVRGRMRMCSSSVSVACRGGPLLAAALQRGTNNDFTT